MCSCKEFASYLKGRPFSKLFACKKLHYPRPKGDTLQESPTLISFFGSEGGNRPQGTTFKFEYLCELEIAFKSQGPLQGQHEKNQRPKISCHCPFKIIPELCL
jgi:hypothetical protein